MSVDRRSELVIYDQVTEDADVPIVGAGGTLTDLSGRQLDRTQPDSGAHDQVGVPRGGGYLVTCTVAAHQSDIALVMVADVPVHHDFAFAKAGARVSGTVCTTGS